jgi:hypothetical protein
MNDKQLKGDTMNILDQDFTNVDLKRAKMTAEINANAKSREVLAAEFGSVYNTDELMEHYEIISFAAPFVYGVDRATKKKGTLIFQHNPRFYHSFKEA